MFTTRYSASAFLEPRSLELSGVSRQLTLLCVDFDFEFRELGRRALGDKLDNMGRWGKTSVPIECFQRKP